MGKNDFIVGTLKYYKRQKHDKNLKVYNNV